MPKLIHIWSVIAVVPSMPGTLHASTLSSDDIAAIWDTGALTLALGNAFDTLRLATVGALHSASETAHSQPPVLQALATLMLVSVVVIWCVPRLPPFSRVRRHWRQLSFADRATWRMR